MPKATKNKAGSLYRSYFRTLYVRRMSRAVFWLSFLYFLIWALPWVPGGLSAEDYTPEFVTTIVFAAACIALGLTAAASGALLRRKRETLLAWASLYDETTGLYNRRYFYDRLSLECERSRRFGLSFVLLLVQLLPSPNRPGDERGVSSTALKAGAAAVKDATRVTDVVGLVAKGEFAVLLLGVNAEQANTLAQKVKASLQARLPSLMAASGMKTPPLVAMGVSTYGVDGETPDVLVDRARDALRRQIEQSEQLQPEAA